jgi:cellulose synthase/poly-beta-1,6-N-acetylglucosamine synthase-like glycosyltransferase
MNTNQSNTPPIVSIVIPCLNEKNYIEKCLQSIINCNYPKDALNVYVCDGDSSDGTIEIIKKYEKEILYIHYLRNEAKTTPQALNLGLKIKNYDVGIILGAHAEIHPDFVNACIDSFGHDPMIGCVGGVIENIHENETSQIISLAMSSSFGVGNAYFRTGTKSGYVDTVAFGAYKKEVFEKCGYFDDELVRNQDDEFNFRIQKNGFKIWLSPSIRSKYYVRASYTKLFRQYLQYGYWKVYVNRKHKTVTTIRQLFPAALIAFLISGAILSLFSLYIFIAYLSIILLYLLMALFFALKTMNGASQLFPIMKTFFILHISYGWGYIKGLWDFFLLGKNASEKQTKLSR